MAQFRALPCGDQAISFEFADRIDAGVNRRVIALARALKDADLPGVTDCVPTYRALLVRYDPLILRGADLERRVEGLATALPEDSAPGRIWNVPVHYGGEAGMDLHDLAAEKGLTVPELIALHGSVAFRVFMIGFAPGFAYLGGLPDILHTPRLKVPRQRIPAGAVGIGGQQASISSVAGPSGWRFLGATPVRLFDPGQDPAILIAAGDTVRFHAIDADTFAAMAARAAAGDPLLAAEGAA
ncbi:5-oxoprolinase subunit PxpB [Falsirhodobacter halotolerans]|uniref:5-oxoprolinase subunit PxpB n=1 Tax=Falsirhodobacter halotolerans TaxID=1146892 RepID=UPI001FD40929|nr:5-oxoprolinase subunit PxpB [Falsirhodobacter halotolerans]MCJ8140873.1 5-oxoprolinase subunit PxpB [Falsirhodobacter halotolerans]